MRKTLLLPLMALLFVTCQKEENIQQASPSIQNSLHPKTFKTPEDVFSFLSQEMPEVYTPEEINRVQAMLEEPDNQGHARSGNTVELPAGSVDALQAAVDEAGEGGTVLVKFGEHIENGLVTVGHRVNIIGEDGAEIIFFNPFNNTFPTPLVGGLYLHHAPKSSVRNIDFIAGNDEAGFCVVVENSNQVVLQKNSFLNFQYPITVAESDRVSIHKNIVTGDPDKIFNPDNLGITIITGRSASIINNKVSGFVFGIWACDKGGISWENETHGNFFGQIICKVPDGGLINPAGESLFAIEPGNHWLHAFNNSHDNLYGGIVVVDGGFKNTLLANTGSGNGAYDVDLVGNTERFGFFTPTSSGNRVWSYPNQIVKDCGENNKVIGGTKVDTSVDPCDNVESE